MLSLACRQGKQDIVELLLESGASVNHRNSTGKHLPHEVVYVLSGVKIQGYKILIDFNCLMDILQSCYTCFVQ